MARTRNSGLAGTGPEKKPDFSVVPAHMRLHWDPVRNQCRWLTRGGALVRIDEVTPYCLGHILRKLAQEGKGTSSLYQVVEAEARRRNLPVPEGEQEERWEFG